MEAALSFKSSPLSCTANGLNTSGPIATFALIRPPGHHATTNLCGGYCYLNNVTICASHYLSPLNSRKCIILDIDFHHGNGVEEILQRKTLESEEWPQRCKYISLHAHPDYPYYTTHLPTPLAKTVSSEQYIRLLRDRLAEVREWCDGQVLVLVSLGLDTLSEDPIGGFAGIQEQGDYMNIGAEIGKFVKSVQGKTCFLLEGGYVVEKLGECVEGVFRGYIQALRE
jgi:acetoin utilization deacetylase AcuC-like enzyme